MPVDDFEKVDIISIDSLGNCVLTISDYLEWGDDLEHLLVLQNKINRYLEFIESGQVHISYPEAIGRSIIIDVAMKFPPNQSGFTFLQTAKGIIQAAGYDLRLEN